MRIDIHNYEAFFLDYKEGNLDAAQEKELFAFLEEYPQLKAELESFEPVMLDADIVGVDKSIFKKSEPSEEALIGYVENIIDDKSKNEIEILASQNTVLAKELSLYKSSIVEADLKIKFPNKARLKRGGVILHLQSTPVYMRVAAALLLLLGLFFLVSKLNTNDSASEVKPVLAVETDKKNTEEADVKKELVSPQQEEKRVAVNSSEKKEKNIPGKNSVTPQYIARKGSDRQKDETPVASNTISVSTNTVLASDESPRNEQKDSIVVAQVMPDNKATYRSYYNYSAEDDEQDITEEKQAITASANAGKKTLFQRITNAAKKVNALGVKKVDGEEENGTRSLSIGGLVLSETVSN